MRTEIIKIIEGGLEKNKDKVLSYAQLLAEKLREEGETKFADRISNVLSKNTAHPVYLDEFQTTPTDSESRLDMVEVTMPEAAAEEIILPELLKMKVETYIHSLKHRNKFMEMGVDLPESLLLYGPPGCGKTSLARYISFRTGLPLVTAKLDGLVSSLLGSTSKNIRRIFEYAKTKPCILFLDEFDAIAKSRNDEHEVGELKRVVNSLLQNIDDFNNGSNVLLAATNHEKLLDPAVWRRFTTTIEVTRPRQPELIELIRLFTKNMNCDFCDEPKKMNTLSNLLEGFSPSDIKAICFNTLRKSIIDGVESVKYPLIIQQIFLYKHSAENDQTLVHFMNENGVSLLDVASTLNISMRQVRKIMSSHSEED
ncbi:AAA family ATPase [Paenibacillus solanacearum]|nr:ATP-binding protein [Paenibacillus solanacearum]